MVKLNIGGGKGHPKLPGWTIVDLRDSADLRLNIASEALPFADNSVDVIFTSHTLEHIAPQSLPFVLDEFYRVIKPGGMRDVSGGDAAFVGGIVRIAVPDIASACRAYSEGNRKFFETSELTYREPDAPIGGLLASWFYSTSTIGNGHCHCFDDGYLKWWLTRHRFTTAVRSAYRKSMLPELRSDAFDRHPNDSLFMEAWKAA